MLLRKQLEANYITEINAVGQFIKLVNCENKVKLRATRSGNTVIETEIRAGFELQTAERFDLLVLNSDVEQSIDIWVSKHSLKYDAPAGGSNRALSYSAEHYGGTQKILPFEASRMAVTLFSDTHDFWYGGEGCTPETGIPVRAGVEKKINSSSEVFVSIDEPPLYISGSTYNTINELDGGAGRYDGGYGEELPEYTATAVTANALYIPERHISQYRNYGTIRISETGAKLLNVTGDIRDIVVMDYDKDKVAMLYDNGIIMVYESGNKVAEYNTLYAKSPLNWKKLIYDGERFYAYHWGEEAMNWYTPSDTSAPVFWLALDRNLFIRKTFYDKDTNRVLAICNKDGHQFIYDITGASGLCESFPHALGQDINGSLGSIITFPDMRFSSTHITAYAGGKGLVFNRQSGAITELINIQFVSAQSRGVIYVIKDGKQLISEDDGLTFSPIPNDTTDFGGGVVFGTFSGSKFVTYPLTKNVDGTYKARIYDTVVSQASAISKLRVFKEMK
ncbi:hypothetical protein PA25_04390 [Pseudoalteromonas sp. A25]|uniref:hypothetical protein n=1 Tax=Pseudoalteromonas sp. A25 TaxID=116092 RepID=UPI00126095EB|nr:hypothetical protein [Pseudoalteromonas sp. A25]BBN80454.1 hypothetical protein PA25_04390 [Pseudoalteromonas sp. A25]